MPDNKGTIHIELNEATRVPLNSITPPSKKAPLKFFRITVRDDGSGMDEKTQNRIFDPYFSMKKNGFGLGLAVVKRIISDLGGNIRVESMPNIGSTFTIEIPAKPVKEKAVTSSETALSATQSQRIVLIDDEIGVLITLQALLHAYGYQTTAFDDPEKALDWIAKKPQIDLIITDLVMPRTSGTEVAKTIRKAGLKTPIILCSGYAQDIVNIKKSGVNLIIQKPFINNELLSSISKLTTKQNKTRTSH